MSILSSEIEPIGRNTDKIQFDAGNLFNHPDRNNSEENGRPKTKTKRTNFKIEIRKQNLNRVFRQQRENLLKNFENNQLLHDLIKQSSSSRIDLEKVIPDIQTLFGQLTYGRYKNADLSNLKKLLLKIIKQSFERLSFQERQMLIESVNLLIYFERDLLETDEAEDFLNIVDSEIKLIKKSNDESIKYFESLIILLENVTTVEDPNIKSHLHDCDLIAKIFRKIIELDSEATTKKRYPLQPYQKKIILQDSRSQLVSLVHNVSIMECTNQAFNSLLIEQFMNNGVYFVQNSALVLRTINNILENDEFLDSFLVDQKVCEWFENSIIQNIQILYKDTLGDENLAPEINETEGEVFYYFLHTLMILINSKDCHDNPEYIENLVLNNLNSFYLSEFLIQFAEKDEKSGKHKKYVKKAIEVYEGLSEYSQISISHLLQVTRKRQFEDVVKVFLKPCYFSTCRVSPTITSLLNKMLSKDHRILDILIELGLFDCLDDVLNQGLQVYSAEQIVNLVDLFVGLIETEEDIENEKILLKKQSVRCNRIVKVFNERHWDKRIQKFQDFTNRQVNEKTQAFLLFFVSKINKSQEKY